MKNSIAFAIILALSTIAFNAQSMQLPNDIVEIARIAQPDGKTLVLGSNKYAGKDSISLYRYDTNNQLDQDFGAGGTTIAVMDESLTPESIEIKQDGKILVKSTSDGKEIQAQFNPDGSLDWTFGEGGFLKPQSEKLP